MFLGICLYFSYGTLLLKNIPTSIVSVEGEDISKRQFAPVFVKNSEAVSDTRENGKRFPRVSECEIKLCGILPVADIPVVTVPCADVVPCGEIAGIKLFTEGVAVISTDTFIGADSLAHSPALKAGIKGGDVILSANGRKISASEELTELIEKSDGKVTLELERDGEKLFVDAIPKTDISSGKPRLGVWVRDSSAGIGTLTYYDKDDLSFAALGHPLSDPDTGKTYKISRGELTSASIISVTKGKKGVPGELCGVISASAEPIGIITGNTRFGISGKLNKPEGGGNAVKIAPRDEITEGKAEIVCTVENGEPQHFEVEIKRVLCGGENSSKDMLIEITDKRLLAKTGGIVQGMSGSPIIQSGKLVGAVTHVLVNDPTRGYGIFIDKMLSVK